MARGPRNLHLAFDSGTLTHFAGLVLLQKFVQQLGLRRRLSTAVRFRQRNNRYSITESLLALVYPIILGLGRVETAQLLRRNGVFPYLTGLPAYPDAQRVRRFLLRFAAEGQSGFIRCHDDLRPRMVHQPTALRSVVFDLDSTVLTVYGRQQGAEVGFHPHKRGRPSYMPLLCVEGHTRDCWEARYHPGNTAGSAVTLPLRERALRTLPAGVRRVKIRADGACSDGRPLDWFEAHNLGYVIVARLTKPLQGHVTAVRNHALRHEVAIADFRYQPHGWSRPRRFIAVRRPVPEEPSWQLHLFRLGKFTYQVLVTNLALEPVNVWRFYNARAQAELVIRELKEAYALGKIPSRRWEVNEAYFHLVVFAYNLLNWFRRLCVPPELQRWSLRTLRKRLLLILGELVQPQGVLTLELPASFPLQRASWDTLKRIG